MHDLVLRGGRLIDPGQGIDETLDVAFSGGTVAEIGRTLEAREVRDVSGKMVVPGLIDLHTHVYWGGTSIGVDPERIARQSGTTTLVDAGTAGPGNLAGFRRHVIETCAPRVLPYMNLSFAGIFAFNKAVMVGECTDLRLLNPRECVRVGREHADIIVGIKVRVGLIAGGNSGIAPLDIAIEVAEELGMPVMAHLDHPPPSRGEVVRRLRQGDVLTHCFRPFPNSPATADGRVREECLAARERGVLFDIGHGMGSFGFKTARAMMQAEFLPDVISSDVHCLSIDGPAYDLLTTMSKFLCIGMPLIKVIEAVTATPAAAMKREELATLKCGTVADATILDLEQGRFEYSDCDGVDIVGDQRLALAGMVLNGAWWPSEARD